MIEVEDIMCDQRILASELNVTFDYKRSYVIVPATKLWLAVDLVARAILPSLVNFCYTCIKNQQNVVHNVRHQVVPALAAFLANSVAKSLASVQRITFPVTIRIVREEQISSVVESISDTPENSVQCIVLSEPKNEIYADVIFIHGLHGGLNKTWKQGRWNHDRHKLKYQSPVRRQSTGNMYVPPREQSLKRTFSNMYSKIPKKIARRENESRINETDEEIEIDELEEKENYSLCWPQDWLPQDCPGARVIALNYTTDVLWCPLWQKKRIRTDMIERSKEMTEELLKLGVGKRPIVWVGHSKGGLYIKQILVNAWEENKTESDLSNIFAMTKAIMFYSVPHKGSSWADFTFPLFRRSIELLEIQRNCDFVLDLHKRFLNIFKNENNNSSKPEIFSFIETAFTLMGFMYLKVVAYESADAEIGIKCDVPLDHREICKPASRNCFLYLELVKLIRRSEIKCISGQIN